MCLLLLLEFCAQYADNLVDGFLLEVGLLCQFLAVGAQYLACSGVALLLQDVDDPVLDVVAELIQADVVFVNLLVNLALYVDGVACEHAGQFDVGTALTDGQRDLVAVQEHLCSLLLFVHVHAVHCGRAECAGNHELCV